MELGNQLLFFVAGLGAFNGLLLALYFLFSVRPQRWLNVLFACLMLMLCLRVGKSLFHSFTDLDRIYRQIGLSACILIGPSLYLYIKSALLKRQKPTQKDILHLTIPPLLILLVGIIWPYESKPDAWNKVIVIGIYGIWAAYTVLAGRLLLPVFKKEKKVTRLHQWLLLVFGCVALLCVAYVMAYLGFPYLAGPILFSIVFYVLIGFLLQKENRLAVLQDAGSKYQKQRISTEKGDALLKRLSTAMEEERFYLDSKIKLPQLAAALAVSPHEISQVVNDRLGISFNHYINDYRVKAACQLLESHDHLTVEGIGKEVGFNSRSAFYTAFKYHRNQTPAQYKSQLKAEKH